MSEVVFLSNTNIQIASGSPNGDGVKVSKLISAPLPEGAVLNGVVMDQERVTETLKLAWQSNKLPKSEVTLIINSPQLRANRVDAPLLPEKKMSDFIDRETRDSEYGRFQNPITGWYVVSKDNKAKTQHVVYETAENDFVKKYVDIFTNAGLKLKTIHNGVQIATEYFTKQAKGKTLLYMILDGKSLVTIFFAEGKYYYDSTSRVFAQPGTPDFAREIYSSISSIRQFTSAQHLTETVKDIMFCGLTYNQVSQLANDIINIDSAADISIAQPPSGTSIANDPSQYPFFIYPIAGLRKINDGVSILTSSKQSAKKKSDTGGIKKLIIPFAAILGVLVLVYAGTAAFKAIKSSELKAIEQYINNPTTKIKVAEYDSMYNNMAEMGEIQGGVDLLNQYIDSYPVPDSSINKMITSAAKKYDVDVDFNSYNAATGVFKITASSPEVEDINQFIAELLSMDIFENVDYTGYAIDSKGEYWQINVVCTLAANDTVQDAATNEEVN